MFYSERQLIEFITLPESTWLERKQSLSDKDKICKTICAFSNDLANSQKAGVLFIGIANNGQIVGVQDDDSTLTAIDQIRLSGQIQPLPSMTIRVLSVGGKKIIAIVVVPSSLPPVRFDGRVWVRMSASTQLGQFTDEKILLNRRTRQTLSFDAEAVPSAKIADLNRDYFEDTYLPTAIDRQALVENGRTYEEKLMTTRMARYETDAEVARPTVAGLLTLAYSPQDSLAGAYVQFVRYQGTEQGGTILDQTVISGILENLIRQTEDKLRAQIRTSLQIVGSDREVASPDYPFSALQQLFRNAVLHRDYEGTNAPIRVYWFDDRIEIWNPGGPFGTVNLNNFGKPHATDYRNPIIAEAMKNLGFVQKFGFGINNARQECVKNNNPEPEFLPEVNSVLVVIRMAQ